MINHKKEKQIRTLLKAGISGYAIASRVGVSTGTVYAIRDMVKAISELSTAQQVRIKTSLDTGMSVKVLEAQMRISRVSIRAVRRYFYLHIGHCRNKELSTCPTCGAVRNSGSTCEMERLDEAVFYRAINRENVVAMYRVIEDIVALGGVGVIVNPLFHDLLPNAKKIVEEFSGNKNQ